MTAIQPPMLGEYGRAPSGVCSRWLGDSPCGAAGTHHVIWDSEMTNGCVCDVHAAEIRQNWVYIGLHPYAAACAASGVAVYLPDHDLCVFPIDELVRLTEELGLYDDGPDCG